jgi:hypothetical protein
MTVTLFVRMQCLQVGDRADILPSLDDSAITFKIVKVEICMLLLPTKFFLEMKCKHFHRIKEYDVSVCKKKIS